MTNYIHNLTRIDGAGDRSACGGSQRYFFFFFCSERTSEGGRVAAGFFVLMCFPLKSVTLWCQSKCAQGPKRPLGSGEVWSLRATFKHRGAVPFPESRKPHFWGSSVGSISLISSSDTVPGWSAGMQPEKHLGGILWTFPDSKEIRHRHSRAGLIRLLWREEGGARRNLERWEASQSACVLSRNYASEILSKL